MSHPKTTHPDIITPEMRAEARLGIEAILSDGGPDVVYRLTEAYINSYNKFGANGFAAGHRAGVGMFCGRVDRMPDGKIALGNIDLTKVASKILDTAGLDHAEGSQVAIVALGLRQSMEVRRDIICGALVDEQTRRRRVATTFPDLAQAALASIDTITACIEIAKSVLPAELVPIPGYEDDEPTGG